MCAVPTGLKILYRAYTQRFRAGLIKFRPACGGTGSAGGARRLRSAHTLAALTGRRFRNGLLRPRLRRLFNFDRVISALPLVVCGPVESESQRRFLPRIDMNVGILDT